MSNPITPEARAAAEKIREDRPENPIFWHEHEVDMQIIQQAIDDSQSAELSRLRERVKELEALCETSYQFHLNKLTTQEQRQLGIWLAEQHLRAATQPQP